MDFVLRLRVDLLARIRHDANDRDPGLAVIESDPAADRIFRWPIVARERLIDDRDLRAL